MSYRVLMITSETVPFAKSGGLADMVSALSIALSRKGADVRILMPLYGFLNKESLNLVEEDFTITFPDRVEKAAIYSSRLPDSEVPVYFLKSEKYFDRVGIYGPTAATSYPDNGLRYSLLSQAALNLPAVLDWEPEIYHSHDWPTGLQPVYLKKARFAGVSRAASVFTIHNIGYQGDFSIRDIPWTGLTLKEAEQYKFIADERMNFLKAAIENCQIITTVSPTYSREIQTPAYGHGLEDTLSERKDFLEGIVNGVDYQDWNPEVDKHIHPDNYSASSPKAKNKVKIRLQKEFGLPVSPETPVFAMVSRLADQKGIHELCSPGTGVLEPFCKENDVQVIILGTGEDWCETELERLADELPNLAVKIAYNDYLSHMIEAGADFFMMPSRYEPCGLNQLYSLKYGTLPIVRRTGGLADTVQNSDEVNTVGTGFLFDEIGSEAFMTALLKACRYWFEKPELILKMRGKAMKEDFSWGPSADAYLKVYDRALEL